MSQIVVGYDVWVTPIGALNRAIEQAGNGASLVVRTRIGYSSSMPLAIA